MAVIYEKQLSDISWYSKPLTNAKCKDNFDRILKLRQAMCNPLTINVETGELNMEYFKTKEKETALDWRDIELMQLFQGIYNHGVSSVKSWSQIANGYLPQRDFIEVRIKLSKMLGIQDLSKYKNVKFENEIQVSNAFNENKKEGIEKGIWNEECQMIFKENIRSLNQEDLKKMNDKESKKWKEYFFAREEYLFRHEDSDQEDMDDNQNYNINNDNNNEENNQPKDICDNRKIDDMFQKEIKNENNHNNNNNNNNSNTNKKESDNDTEMMCID